MRVSIIVPVLNEGAILDRFLRQLREHAPGAELIVVDGGSMDRSMSIAERHADITLRCAPASRAAQMNAGARAATGDVFWFVHADSTISAANVADMARALRRDTRLSGGCFRLRILRREWIYRVTDSVGNAGVHVFGFALGDHGIFCRREAFEAVGGYRNWPILEDAEFYRALRRNGGRMRQLRPEIASSPRRYEALGPYRTTLFYIAILALYVTGARMETMLRVYRRLLRTSARVRVVRHAPASLAAARAQ